MSESDPFLSRWSRRKRAAAQESAPDVPAAPPPTGKPEKAPEPQTAVARADGSAARETKAEPVFDLSKLPSLDSIGPQSDIRMFLQPGVPSALSHAALRRAWSADPAIRDFIGLSENSWDFTATDSVPGFGPLLPTDNVKQLLAQIFGGAEESKDGAAAKPSAKPEVPSAENRPDAGAQETDPPSIPAQSAPIVAGNDASPDGLIPEPSHRTSDDGAMQQERATDGQDRAPAKRRHGGALPG
ncbi:MAG: DUF3306 domain-containing protein [Pseudorhodoplanes sp.]